MCGTCGCGDSVVHEEVTSQKITLEHALLQKNDDVAHHNRHFLEERQITAVNLMSSPGAGKTTLLERTLAVLRRELPVYVIEGDQETSRDAERLRHVADGVLQINTGTGCHL